jgi:dipeptidyl aminopeptidase/acylaminoacyl peptidase
MHHSALAHIAFPLVLLACALGCGSTSEIPADASTVSSSPTPAAPQPSPAALHASAQTASDRPAASLPASPYAEARAKFQTRLLRRGPAPQRHRPISPPPGARAIPYRSGELRLKAWVSAPPSGGERRPAVLFLHGGFAFDEDDWEMSRPYRDAGFVVLTPLLRGENGLPGDYSLFFHELDDVLAATDALAALPYVRADRLYVAGHSVGGTLTLLAAMRSGRFRAAASFSGSPDQAVFTSGHPEIVPFDRADPGELRIRSPAAYPQSFLCPVRAYHGSSERFFAAATAQLAEEAQREGLDVRAVPVPGDHMSHVAEAMRQSIEFFRQKE